MNKKLKIEHNLKNQLYSQAIETNDQENFREFKNMRNIFYNNLKEAKNSYYNRIFSDNNKKNNDLLDGEINFYKSKT